MSWTKRQLVSAAYAEIGYADYAYDLEPEQLQQAMNRMDAMMAVWSKKGIRVGYPLVSSPENADLDTETNIPDWVAEAVYSNLAIRLTPPVGKMIPEATKIVARSSYRDVLSLASNQPNEMQLPTTMPSGAGNKPWRNRSPFIQPVVDDLDVGRDGELDL